MLLLHHGTANDSTHIPVQTTDVITESLEANINYSGEYDRYFNGVFDTRIQQNNPNANYSTDVALSIFKWAAGDIGNGLLKFDLSNIPAGATILDVKIRGRTATPSANGDSSYTIGLYRLKRNWIPLEATWNQYSSGNAWSFGGARSSDDIDVNAVTTLGVNVATGVWYEFTGAGLISLVQGWVNGTFPNYGVMLERSDIYEHIDVPVYVGQSRTFTSSEGTNGNRIEIVIQWEI
ncbi:MAG: DNRLRE domain-containing protein [Balneolaceae bacterium]